MGRKQSNYSALTKIKVAPVERTPNGNYLENIFPGTLGAFNTNHCLHYCCVLGRSLGFPFRIRILGSVPSFWRYLKLGDSSGTARCIGIAIFGGLCVDREDVRTTMTVIIIYYFKAGKFIYQGSWIDICHIIPGERRVSIFCSDSGVSIWRTWFVEMYKGIPIMNCGTLTFPIICQLFILNSICRLMPKHNKRF